MHNKKIVTTLLAMSFMTHLSYAMHKQQLTLQTISSNKPQDSIQTSSAKLSPTCLKFSHQQTVADVGGMHSRTIHTKIPLSPADHQKIVSESHHGELGKNVYVQAEHKHGGKNWFGIPRNMPQSHGGRYVDGSGRRR